MYYSGWSQVAFERDSTKDLAPSAIAVKRLILVRTLDGIRTFDAICPHRGAHLAFGGKLDGEGIICPFHGYRIGLNRLSDNGFRVCEYRTIVIGGLVFALISDSYENGFDNSHFRTAHGIHNEPKFLIKPSQMGSCSPAEWRSPCNGLCRALERDRYGVENRSEERVRKTECLARV